MSSLLRLSPLSCWKDPGDVELELCAVTRLIGRSGPEEAQYEENRAALSIATAVRALYHQSLPPLLSASSLTSLHLRDVLRNSGLGFVENLTALEQLCISKWYSDKGVKFTTPRVSVLARLRRLCVRDIFPANPFASFIFAQLQRPGGPRIEALEMNDMQVNAVPAAFFGHVAPSLTCLNFSKTSLAKLPRAVSCLTRLRMLHANLEYTGRAAQNEWMEVLPAATLQQAVLRAAYYGLGENPFMGHFQRLTSLQDLTINCQALGPIALPPLPIGSVLRRLNLCNVRHPLHAGLFAGIPPTLESLKIICPKVTQNPVVMWPPDAEATITCLTRLSSLEITDQYLLDIPVAIGRLRNLQSVVVTDRTTDIAPSPLLWLPPEWFSLRLEKLVVGTHNLPWHAARPALRQRYCQKIGGPLSLLDSALLCINDHRDLFPDDLRGTLPEELEVLTHCPRHNNPTTIQPEAGTTTRNHPR